MTRLTMAGRGPAETHSDNSAGRVAGNPQEPCSRIRWEVITMKKTDIRDQFPKGMRVTLVNVAIERHRERYCGRTGVVVKAVKSTNTVWIEFPDGDRYGAYPENVRPA